MQFKEGLVGSILKVLKFLGLTFFCSACAHLQQDVFVDVESQLRAQQNEAALASLEKLNRFYNNRALYELNRGMILHYMGNYQESISAFERAKKYIGILDPVSITESIAAYTLTEQLRSYKATVYEKLFLHMYQIMNFLAINQPDSARVELMQVDLALKTLNQKGHYLASAAARYVSGLIFESLNEHDNALIAYRQAYQNYKQTDEAIPRDLRYRLVNLAHIVGLDDEAMRWQQEFDLPKQNLNDSNSQLVIFYNVDFAPVKEQISESVIDPSSGQWYRLSLPYYQRRNVQNVYFEATISEQGTWLSDTLADIESIAINDLEKQLPELTMRAISRNIARRAVTKEAEEEHEILGGLVNIVGAIFDEADIRNWRTLPNNIQLSARHLLPGTYSISLKVLNERGVLIDHHTIDDVVIEPNRTKFLSFSWFRPDG